ncbi:plasminogen-binding N-terminal domain-containing protein [Hydrogenimonas cancrithermarum]|uniref:Plasminogen-binding protein PgbA N-terminal domain-containing protein n=1 Tax=Hydrogenimonas cancrithermarum TaxID=2993563 RepID=A0ABN6WUW7_9BACT|nr:plasminogen-binding N-terminal domain-containing protein [Hydrogenimonas cancrithermarum]BDY12661.1 hypothetical protein HCR_09730 [Hydrogenimonas cancrithermarum]
MIRLFLSFLLFVLTLGAAEGPRSVTATLQNVDKEYATIDIGNLPIGASGIVIHRYNDSHRAIVASAAITASDASGTKIHLLPYHGLVQPKLPTIKTKPQNGDTVILGYLYDRVLPIVPNQKSLEKAKAEFPHLTLVHPDLFAAELSKVKEPLPRKRHFRRMCEKMHLGLVMFMFQDGTDFIDCISWKKVGHADVASVDEKEFKAPFFHRFESIPSAFFDWSDYTMNDFDRYYKKVEKK